MPRRRSAKDHSIPLHEEAVTVGKRTVERRKRISTRVHERSETVEAALKREEPVISRVRVDRAVSEAPPLRQEGDTLIIPVLEEVAVVERRLILREEVHVRIDVMVTPFREQVTLRSEEVVVIPAPRPADVTENEAEAGSQLTAKHNEDQR